MESASASEWHHDVSLEPHEDTVHNAGKWLAVFLELARVNPNHLKKHRMVIQRQTWQCVESGLYPNPAGGGCVVLHQDVLRRYHCTQTTLYNAVPQGYRLEPKFDDGTQVFVLEADCVEGAQWLASKCERVALLNMANRSTPGGGYRGGSGAQEENLMRRSNYFESIEDRGGLIQGKGVADARYPLPLEGCIVSRRVCFFRGSESKGYPYLEEPLFFGVIACAAISRPRLTKEGELSEEEEATTLGKMRCILYGALKEGFDGVVLSAFGCGAFRNPPVSSLIHSPLSSCAVNVFLKDHIARLFRRVCDEFRGCFRCIAFSIIEGVFFAFPFSFSQAHLGLSS